MVKCRSVADYIAWSRGKAAEPASPARGHAAAGPAEAPLTPSSLTPSPVDAHTVLAVDSSAASAITA